MPQLPTCPFCPQGPLSSSLTHAMHLATCVKHFQAHLSHHLGGHTPLEDHIMISLTQWGSHLCIVQGQHSGGGWSSHLSDVMSTCICMHGKLDVARGTLARIEAVCSIVAHANMHGFEHQAWSRPFFEATLILQRV